MESTSCTSPHHIFRPYDSLRHTKELIKNTEEADEAYRV